LPVIGLREEFYMSRRIVTRPVFLVTAWLLAFTTPWACVTVHAEGQQVVNAGAATPDTASQSQSATASSPVQPAEITTYPQVSMTAFTRVYRSRSSPASASAGDAAAAIEAALDKPGSRFEFNEMPLRDVIAKLREAHSIPVELDQKALEDAGVDLDTPITQHISGISLRSALRLLLDTIDLTYRVENEVLQITTKEVESMNPTVRLYPLPWGIAAQARPDVQALIDLITSTVRPETWDSVGGYGSVRPIGESGETTLVVSQTQECHWEVEGLFRGLHQQALAEFGDSSSPRAATPVFRAYHIADVSTLKALSEKLVKLCNESLGEAGDPAATVGAIGQSLVVQSVSPEFHALAGRMVAAITGVTTRDPLGTTPQPVP
jgi:hypothetical protein